jgi:hypothetical protein
MSLRVNSGLTSVTGSVVSTALKNSLISITGTSTTAQTVTLGTVGAGKVWRIVYMEITQVSGAGGGTNSIQINNVDVLSVRAWGTATANQSTTASFIGSYGDALTIPATQTLKLVTGAGVQCVYNIFYVEENA